jgi:hypothetical protein
MRCAWGELTESGSLHTFQQAILTALPPTITTFIQYTTQLTSAICIDNTVWHHTVRNAWQDKILPHSLHNPITIFNTHNNSHFTALITKTTPTTTMTSSTFDHPLRPTRYTTHFVNGTRDSISNIHSSEKFYPRSTTKAPLNKPTAGRATCICSSSTSLPYTNGNQGCYTP